MSKESLTDDTGVTHQFCDNCFLGAVLAVNAATHNGGDTDPDSPFAEVVGRVALVCSGPQEILTGNEYGGKRCGARALSLSELPEL